MASRVFAIVQSKLLSWSLDLRVPIVWVWVIGFALKCLLTVVLTLGSVVQLRRTIALPSCTKVPSAVFTLSEFIVVMKSTEWLSLAVTTTDGRSSCATTLCDELRQLRHGAYPAGGRPYTGTP